VKKVFSNIGSIFLALIVLFSTFSFTIEKHFCGGELADYSFIGNLNRCEMPAKTHDDTKETFLNKVPCCQDSVEIIDSTNDELSVTKELNIQTVQLLAAFVYSYTNLFDGLEEHIVPFKNYAPPLVVADIQLLHDTFLI